MNNFYANLEHTYGLGTRNLFKSLANCYGKKSSLTARKVFLCQCRRYGIFPTHITNALSSVNGLFSKNLMHTVYFDKVLLKFKRMTLNAEIKLVHCDLNTLKKEMNSIIVEIKSSNCVLLNQFLENQEKFFQKRISDLSNKHNKKFAAIHTTASGRIPFDDKWIVNLTDVQVPEDVSHLLSLGQKFALPYKTKKDIPMARLLAEVEVIVRTMNCTNDDRDTARSQITNEILNYTYKREPKNPLDKWLFETTKSLREFVKNHNDIIITSADKGGKTVILKKEDYEAKMHQLTSDTTTYKPIKRDRTSHFQTKNNDIARRLRNLCIIDDNTKASLTTYKALPPRMYGLPKIHKENVPLRPIVSCIGSPTHALSRFCNDILKNITEESPYKLKNSYDFIKRIKDLCVEDGYVLVSFDVVSLFTNIPRDLAMEVISEKWEEIQKYTNIPSDLFTDMISLVMNSGYFKYNGNFYQQIDGMPMGNCLSPAIADMIIDHIIDKAMEFSPHPPKAIYKYVDDLFLIARDEYLNELLNVFNSIHAKIQFTHELERDNLLPFLDTLVKRNEDGTITTTWYQKQMASGRILNFASLHPMKQKINTAQGVIHRVKSLTTDPLCDTNTIITKLLLKNNYPQHMIKKLLDLPRSERDSNLLNCSFITASETKYCSLTYIKGLSEKIAKTIRGHSQDVTICLKSCNTVGQLFFSKTKDPIDTLDKTNLIYRIPCECGMYYIGRTSRKLRMRVREHQLSAEKLMEEKKNKKKNKKKKEVPITTSLLQHMKNENHEFNFEDTSIVDVASKAYHLQYMEAFYINTYKRSCKSVNLRKEGKDLNQLYNALIPRTLE